MRSLYLDYCATTPIDPEVRDALIESLEHFGNPSSAHPYGWYAEESVSIARAKIATAIGATPEEIIFTSGATEANNLALKGVINDAIPAHFISSPTEHRAVLDPLQLVQAKGHTVDLLRVDSEGHISLDELTETLSASSTLVSLMLANNEIGTIHPIAKIAATCKQHAVLLHCDATQALGKIPVKVDQLGVDLMSLSAHKCYGPKGIGALYVRKGTSLHSQIQGGGHEHGLRSGTLNTSGIVAFGVAAELAAKRQQADETHLRLLSTTLLRTLKSACPVDVVLNNPDAALPGLLNISFLGVSNERLLAKLQTKLAFSLASACQSASKEASHVLAAIGLSSERKSSAIRVSFGRPSTVQDAENAGNILSKAISQIIK